MANKKLWIRGEIVRDAQERVSKMLERKLSSGDGQRYYVSVPYYKYVVFTVCVDDNGTKQYYDVTAGECLFDACCNLKRGQTVEVLSSDFYADTYESKKTGETMATIRLTADSVKVVSKVGAHVPTMVTQGV